MKILVLGDTAGTGFGTVTADLGRALIARGEDLRFVSINEQPNGELVEPFAGRTLTMGNLSGWLSGVGAAEAERLSAAMESGSVSPEERDRLEVILAQSKLLAGMFTGAAFDGWIPETAIVIGDIGSLKMSPVLEYLPEGFPAVHYVPIEGVGLPPRWKEIWDRLPPVAMSEFGATEIARVIGYRPPVVYHGVDTQTFHPVTPATPLRIIDKKGEVIVLRDKTACRKFLGWPPDEFILFRADRNMPRKAYDSLFRCVAPVLARHPKSRLIWHARTFDQGGDLLDERSKYPLQIADRMNSTGFHDRLGGVPRSILVAMYAAADLYVSVSAEGFGLTIAESLACGTPAVGIDFSAVPEVIGKAGRVIPVGGLIPNIYSHFWAIPNERLFAEAIEELMTSPERAIMGKLGPLHVQKSFQWDRAAAQFAELLTVRELVVA